MKAVAMSDVFALLRQTLPVHVYVRLVVVDVGPPWGVNPFRGLLYRLGVWFIRRSGLVVGEE
jgi:hypothetical protein